MTLDINHAGVWSRLHAPNIHRAHWHEEDGSRAHFLHVLACAAGGAREHAIELHAQSIKDITLAAIEAHTQGRHAEARRLAMAAGRLAQEICGLWSPAAMAVGQ
jgi:hypothetical protein